MNNSQIFLQVSYGEKFYVDLMATTFELCLFVYDVNYVDFNSF